MTLCGEGRKPLRKKGEIDMTTKRCIYVDDDNFNYSEIEKIILTPQSYSSGNQNRMMKIAKTDGTKVIYNLGFKAWKPNKPDSVFEKYDEFSYLLEGLFINTPGKFQYDL